MWFIILSTNICADWIALIMKWNLARVCCNRFDWCPSTNTYMYKRYMHKMHITTETKQFLLLNFSFVRRDTQPLMYRSIFWIWAFLRFVRSIPVLSIHQIDWTYECVRVTEWQSGLDDAKAMALATCCSCCIFDIIWLVHIIDLDELYFVATTFRLLSKWLFNSVSKREQAMAWLSHSIAHSTYWLCLLIGLLRLPGTFKAVKATNPHSNIHTFYPQFRIYTNRHAIVARTSYTHTHIVQHIRKWKFSL